MNDLIWTGLMIISCVGALEIGVLIGALQERQRVGRCARVTGEMR